MFDDDFKFDFEDMEGLSLNGDAFHIFKSNDDYFKFFDDIFDDDDDDGSSLLVEYEVIGEDNKEDIDEMNKTLTFLIQDKADFEEMLDTIKSSGKDICQALITQGIITTPDADPVNYVSQLRGLVSYLSELDFDYDYIFTIGCGSDGRLFKKLYSSSDAGNKSDNYLTKRTKFFQFANRDRFIYYKAKDKVNVVVYCIYKDYENYEKYFENRAPQIMKDFVKLHYTGQYSYNIYRLQVATIILFADFDTLAVTQFNKLFSQFIPVLIKKATFSTVADEKVDELAKTGLKYIKDLLMTTAQSSEMSNRSIIDGVIAKYKPEPVLSAK